MTKLYSELAAVYEVMYATFIDYKTEYSFYSEILSNYEKNNLLEIGCGTGNLSQYFEANGFEIKAIIDRPTYAFPTYVIIAKLEGRQGFEPCRR